MRNKFVVWVLEKFKDEREIQGYERAYMAKVYCKRYASDMPPFFLFISLHSLTFAFQAISPF